MIKKLYGLLIILSICSLCISPIFAGNGDPVLEGKTATGNIITTGTFVGGTAGTLPGAMILYDEGRLTFWDDGGDFSTYFRMFDDTTQLGFWGILNVSGNVIAGGSFLPDSNDGTYIGSAALGFSDGYFADGAVVYFGNDQDVTLTHTADTGLSVNLNLEAATLTYGGAEVYRVGGTDVAIADGGTGAGTAAAGFNALSPMTAIGDLIYGGASGAATVLTAGATTTILVGGGAAAPVWTTATGTGAPARAGSPVFTTDITAPIVQLTGGNIVFPATAVPVAGANTLDDYEEGLSSPTTITCNTSGSFTMIGESDTLAYTKVGRMVHVQGLLGVSADDSCNGYLKISLPFAVAALEEDSGQGYGVAIIYNGGGTIIGPFGVAVVGQSFMKINTIADNGTLGSVDESNVDAAWNMYVSITYFTD
jgi:hypothetical protein